MAPGVCCPADQIPNCHYIFPSDPERKRREEDALIGWAWRQYLDGNASRPEWLPRFPMVKAGMACMRAAGQYAAHSGLGAVDGWLVSGASKRGWTSWMVSAPLEQRPSAMTNSSEALEFPTCKCPPQ